MANIRLFFLIILSINLTACYQNKKLRDNTLVYCTENIPVILNPQLNHDIATLDATTHQLFSRLVKIDHNSGKFVPDLAESWQLSQDKLHYRFTLRQNVSFHNTDYFTPTRYVNADDVLFSFQRMLDNEHPFHSINGQADSFYFTHPFTSFLKEIKKVDEHTIEFELTKPDVRLLANLAAHYAVIHSQQYGQQLLSSGKPENFDLKPIGTGPYQLNNHDDDVIRYHKNALYWQPMSNIENLIFVKNANATKRYTKLLSKECDVISYPAASQIDYISNNPAITLNSELTSDVALWSFNTKRKQLQSAQVRQALSYAIDKQTILNAVYYQSATPTSTLLSNQSWAVKARPINDDYNPDKALKMLQQANYDFSKTLTILVPENADTFNPNFHKTAELIQANLQAIGIPSDILNLNQSAIEVRLLTGNYDTYLTGMNIHINDPDSVFRPLLSCDASPIQGNTSGWCSAHTESLINRAIIETNFAQRIKNYYQIQDEVYNNRPYLPLAHIIRLDAISSSIDNIEVNPLTGINFQYAVKKEFN